MLGLFADAAWRVLAVGLLIGAGLPAIFALGIKSLAYGVGGDAEVSHERGHPVGRIGAAACFAIVLVAIGIGITIIVASGFGKAVVFDNLVPMVVDKHR